MSWVWIEIEKRFADAAYHPDWLAFDRPVWTVHNAQRQREFAAWIHRLLGELEAHVREERLRELPNELTPELLQSVRDNLKSGALLGKLKDKIANVRLAKPKATINDIIKMEEREELAANGWTRGPGRPPTGANPHKPAAKAARDLWRIRHVILPRFWPEGAKAGRGLTNERLAAIAAARHKGATASATLAWYENERLSAT